jgi:phosphopantetheinyl transferase
VTLRPRKLEVTGARAPWVYLFDVHGAAVDEEGLRALARGLCRSSTEEYSSRSYRYPLALVALHDRPVGIDIERVSPWDAAHIDGILTPAERANHRPTDDRWATSLWSSKEALAKGLGDPVSYDPRRLESPIQWNGGCAGRWKADPLNVPDEYVAWLCWQPLTQLTGHPAAVTTQGVGAV